jgi:hypothetical protein
LQGICQTQLRAELLPIILMSQQGYLLQLLAECLYKIPSIRMFLKVPSITFASESQLARLFSNVSA